MKIEQFDKTNLRFLSTDIQQALVVVGAKYGISLTYKGARYEPTNATLKIEAAIIGANGIALQKEREDFKLYAQMYGLKPEDLDKDILYGNNLYTIVGVNLRRPKYPIIAKRIYDGKTMLLTASGVKMALARQIGFTVNTPTTPAAPPQPTDDVAVDENTPE